MLHLPGPEGPSRNRCMATIGTLTAGQRVKRVGEGTLAAYTPSLLAFQMGRLPVPRLPWLPVSSGAWRLPALERVGRLPAADAGCAAPAGPPVAPRGLLPSADR